MNDNARITFEGAERSPYLVQQLRHALERLERFYGDVVSADIRVRPFPIKPAPSEMYEIGVELRLRDGRDVRADRFPAPQHCHRDFHIALDSAFAGARHQLRDGAFSA